MVGDDYKGALFPVTVLPDGNFLTGARRETIRSDIRMIFLGRRFVNADNVGDRVMRPGFGSIFWNQLMSAFDDDVMVPVAKSEVASGLRLLEQSRLIRVQSISVSSPQAGALKIRIAYIDRVDDFRDAYEFEVETQSPASNGGG